MKGWFDHVSVPKFQHVLWVVGPSSVGKSTFARDVVRVTGATLVEAGHWARAMCPPEASVEELTSVSRMVLRRDERYFSRLIGEELGRLSLVVLAGSRNPIDFVDNFDVLRDAVVFLGLDSCEPSTVFEEAGIAAIAGYVAFLLRVGLLNPDRACLFEPRRHEID